MFRLILILLCCVFLINTQNLISSNVSGAVQYNNLLEGEDTLPPVPKWKLKCDGNVTGATVTDMPDDPQIRAGLQSIVYDNSGSYNYTFDYEAFEPGKVYTTIWRLKIIDVKNSQNPIMSERFSR